MFCACSHALCSVYFHALCSVTPEYFVCFLFSFFPDLQVKAAWLPFDHIHSTSGQLTAGICSLFQVFPEIIMQLFLHYFTPERLRIFQVLNLKKKKKWSNKDFGAERTWTGDHSLKNPSSIHLGYLRVDEYRWKKIEWNHFGDRHRLPVPALHRLLFPSASKILAWLFSPPYWPQLCLGQYVGSKNNRPYFLSLGK